MILMFQELSSRGNRTDRYNCSPPCIRLAYNFDLICNTEEKLINAFVRMVQIDSQFHQQVD